MHHYLSVLLLALVLAVFISGPVTGHRVVPVCYEIGRRSVCMDAYYLLVATADREQLCRVSYGTWRALEIGDIFSGKCR